MRRYILIFIGLILPFMAAAPGRAIDSEELPNTPDGQSKPGAFIITSGAWFRDCVQCPEMAVVPPGRFLMGSPEDERGRSSDEGPQHEVIIGRPFAMARFEVTIAQWQACVEARQCRDVPDDRRGGGNQRPVSNVSWLDTQEYVKWLSSVSGKRYHLPTEAEWEYAARAGATSPHYWPERGVACAFANVYDISGQRVHQFSWPNFTCIDANAAAAPVGDYLANDFGLHDMLGNVWEWVQDCWTDGYVNAPGDGRANLEGDCGRRVVRGGSWKNITWGTRSAFRGWQGVNDRVDANGFRVARYSE